MRANVEHNLVLHEHVVIMAIDTMPVPRIPDSERTEVDALGYAEDGLIHLTAHFGYMEKPNILGVLRLLEPAQTEGAVAVDDASYFLSKLELTKGRRRTWRVGASNCSSRPPTSLPTPPITSDCRPTAQWSWVRG